MEMTLTESRFWVLTYIHTHIHACIHAYIHADIQNGDDSDRVEILGPDGQTMSTTRRAAKHVNQANRLMGEGKVCVSMRICVCECIYVYIYVHMHIN